MYRHSAGNLYPLGNTSVVLSSCSVSSVLSLLEPVTPSALSISGRVSKRLGRAACATGGFDEVVVVVVVDDEAVPPPLLPPHAVTKIPAAATATTAGS